MCFQGKEGWNRISPVFIMRKSVVEIENHCHELK